MPEVDLLEEEVEEGVSVLLRPVAALLVPLDLPERLESLDVRGLL